jgi:hypothetical protein
MISIGFSRLQRNNFIISKIKIIVVIEKRKKRKREKERRE